MQKICFIKLILIFFIIHLHISPFIQAQTLTPTKITFQADVPLSHREFFYLIELKPNHPVNTKDLEKARKNLLNKNRFSSIDIKQTNYKSGTHLHFILHGNWIFNKLNINGIVFGKHEYENLYTQEQGDIFNTTLHEESINTIKTHLRNQGYFNSTVTDELSYSSPRKTITVDITICCKKRFAIKSINFETQKNKRIEQKLTSMFRKLLANKYYSKKQITKQAKKIKQFLNNKHFYNNHIVIKKKIDLKKHTVDLTFCITLGKKRIVHFKGNKYLSTEELTTKIIDPDQPDWLFSPDIIAEQIFFEYYRKGFWQSSVSYKKYSSGEYLFTISENKPILIDKIKVKNISTQTYEKNIECYFKDLLDKKILDQPLLEKSLEQLKNFYQRNGFWDFKVVEKQFPKNKYNKTYRITLLINKGKQRIWSGFSLSKFKQLESHDFFKKYLLTETTKPLLFDINWLQEQKTFLLDYFQRQGYWYVNVKPLFQNSQQEKTKSNRINVFVKWEITPGPQVTFGKIFIRGNTKLPFKRILKEIKFKDGDPWSKEKLEFTRKKLKQLDVFKKIQIQAYQLSENKSKKPVMLTLIDDDPIEVHMRCGYFLTSKNFLFKRQSTPKLGTSLEIKNVTNRADHLAINFDITKFERNFYARYQQTSFLGIPAQTKIKGYANKYVHPVEIGSSGSAYEALQTGFLIGLSNEYKTDYFWGISVGNEWIKTSRVRGNLKLNPHMIDNTLPYLFVEPSLIIDKRDDKINTTKGSLSFLSLKTMIPEKNGDITFRVIAEHAFFQPIYRDIIAALHIRFGHIFRRKFENIMPIERFYLGGPYSVRGYEKDALPPLGISQTTTKDGTSIKTYTIQGGSSMINGNLELRFPLYKSFGAVIFQDIGVLSQSGFSGFAGTWYPSSGFGFRYKTPIGAFRFDIGWKWKRRIPGDSAYTWYLTLGQAF